MSTITEVGAAYLWQTAATQAVAALRVRAWALLGLLPGARVLDIGCGPGTTLAGLASLVGPYGRIAGVDHDAAMVRQATEVAARLGLAGIARIEQADATALPFPAAGFDACYCERVLQHLPPEQGRAAVADAARVLRPGGAAVFVDSDWPSFSVDSGEDALERRLQAAHLARFRNPFAARGLARTMRACGFGFVHAEPFAVPLSAPGITALLAGAEADALAAGAITEEERVRWQHALAARAAEPGPAGHLTMIIALGRRV
jgi:ubiquinone/menaquinone biosynthesis C-methylase UbiE